MSKSRIELKVGAFVLFCLVLLGLLLIQFSKGNTLFRRTYLLTLDAENVAGLKAEAGVLMSGVKVGTVLGTDLSPQGTNVFIHLKIYGDYVIREDAHFVIESSGFLGDQYIAIYPGLSEGKPLTNGATAHADAPFNLQEAARSADGFIKRMDATAKKLDDAISDVRKYVLNQTTLTNLAFTISTLKQASQDAQTTVDNINQIIKTNGAPVNTAVSNISVFTEQLRTVAQSVQDVVNTNREPIAVTLSNLSTSSAMLTNILGGVVSGNGVAGGLVKNQAMATDLSTIVSNLAVTTGNLNRMGLWHFLWYHPKPEQTTAPKFSPTNAPFRSPADQNRNP